MDRQSPLGSMESWLEQMNRQFEMAAESWGGDSEWSTGMDQPRLDMIEHDDEYIITADLPGFSSEDVEVYVSDGTLTIEAERTDEVETDEGNFIKRERSQSTLSRRVNLAGDVDVDGMSASLDDGVLTVQAARSESLDDGHEIAIE